MFQPRKCYEFYKCPVIRTCPPLKRRLIYPTTPAAVVNKETVIQFKRGNIQYANFNPYDNQIEFNFNNIDLNNLDFLNNNKLYEISFDIDEYQRTNQITYDFYYQERGGEPTKLGSVTLKGEKGNYGFYMFPSLVTLSNLDLKIKPNSRIYIKVVGVVRLNNVFTTTSGPNVAGIQAVCKNCNVTGYTNVYPTGTIKFKGAG